uniref:Proteasome assembly chaperone 1 n=1 Tax=Gadus morhua TaxID=8049 RepID=A0A8C4ZX23_GADMO
MLQVFCLCMCSPRQPGRQWGMLQFPMRGVKLSVDKRAPNQHASSTERKTTVHAGCWRREEPFLCTHCVSATGVVCMSASTASIVSRSPSKKGSSVCSGSGDSRHCALQITNLQHLASCCVYMEQNLEGSFDFQNSLYCKVILCQISGYIEEDQQFQWTEKVLGGFKQKGLSVTVLSDSPVAEYKNMDHASSSSSPFLLCLQTKSSTTNPQCPLLEQPNIFTGIQAAVLSHCQVNQIPAVAYQCYSDAISPDSITMDTYKLAFTSVGDIKVGPLPSADIFNKFIKTNHIQSNLYI